MIRSLLRFITILRTLIIFQLDSLFLPRKYCASFWLWWLCPIRSIRMRNLSEEKRLLQALIELGPIFVKFGQSLSTRVDLLNTEMAQALATLQDNVPPFEAQIARKMVEQAYKQPLNNVLEHFENKPLGSASIAQVHAAKLLNGEDVVIKLLRPNIHLQIQHDLVMLRQIAYLIDTFHPKRKQLRAREVVEDYSTTITNELNLVLEASNMNLMKDAFTDDSRIHIPEVYWELTQENILVTERVYGIPITQIETLKKNGTDMHRLAKNGVELFLCQVFQHNFFHADMHPGNIFVDITQPDRPVYQLVDFGIVGMLPMRDQQYLAENLAAFFARDYQRVADLHIESGWVDQHTSSRTMGASIRAIGEPIYGKALHDISFADVLMKLFRVAEKHNMFVQPQLLLLQKTLFHVEGLARQLDDSMALPEIAEPIIKRWLKSKKGILGSAEKIIKKIPEWLAQYPEVKDIMIRKVLHAKTKEQEKPVKQHIKLAQVIKYFIAGIIGYGVARYMSI